MNKIKVLLADDYVPLREAIRHLLEDEPDIEVIGEAGDGEEAIELTTKVHPDVVVMDIAMPKLNGIEATKRIKALHPATAVLILSSYDDEEHVFALRQAGVAGYLLKETAGSDLLHTIRDVHKGATL